jgi:hypothetical protein
MESLALVVAVIVLVTVSLGPISIAISFIKANGARIAGYVTGSGAVLAGLWLAFSVDSSGARLIGLSSSALGLLGIWLNRQRAIKS